jgi:hypothetical protein
MPKRLNIVAFYATENAAQFRVYRTAPMLLTWPVIAQHRPPRSQGRVNPHGVVQRSISCDGDPREADSTR